MPNHLQHLAHAIPFFNQRARQPPLMAECTLCHRSLAEPYGAIVELIRNGAVIGNASVYSLHQQCARDWLQIEIEACEESTVTTRDSASFAVCGSRALNTCGTRTPDTSDRCM
jgi:hypothetical protein